MIHPEHPDGKLQECLHNLPCLGEWFMSKNEVYRMEGIPNLVASPLLWYSSVQISLTGVGIGTPVAILAYCISTCSSNKREMTGSQSPLALGASVWINGLEQIPTIYARNSAACTNVRT
jgi:hypothetical protein